MRLHSADDITICFCQYSDKFVRNIELQISLEKTNFMTNTENI